jgi:hypothetical protein
MVSASMEKLIEEIYADSRISPGEIVKLREAVAEAAERVLSEAGEEGVLAALVKSFDVTTQLLQETVLRFKKSEYTDLARAMVRSVLEANIALLQANLDAFE